MQVIDNKAGQYCSHYPSELVVIEGHLNHSSSDQEPSTRLLFAIHVHACVHVCVVREVLPNINLGGYGLGGVFYHLE